MAKLPPVEQLKSRPLGRVLIKMGKLTRDKVHKALQIQKLQKELSSKGNYKHKFDPVTGDMFWVDEKNQVIQPAAVNSSLPRSTGSMSAPMTPGAPAPG